MDMLFGFFHLKKGKLKWTGSLDDLKALVFAQIDEEAAEATGWKSPSGGTWTFDNDLLSVKWHEKSENIYFQGEKGIDLTKQVHSFLSESDDGLETVDPEKSIENLSKVNGSRESFLQESFGIGLSTPVSTLAQNDEGEIERKLENAINTTKSKTCPKSTYRNFHKELPNPHMVTKPNNPLGSLNTSCTYDSEIYLLKSKLERFAGDITVKLDDLADEINSIKENKPYSIVILENVIDELKKEKLELCRANDELKNENRNLLHTIKDLNLSYNNLENEKSSLLTALQLNQMDRQHLDQNLNTMERPWNIVNTQKTNQTQRKSLHNLTSSTDNAHGKLPLDRDCINLNSVNRYEILNDEIEGRFTKEKSQSFNEKEQVQDGIIVIGDSIIKQIHPNKLSKKKVHKRTFPGKTCHEICEELRHMQDVVSNPTHVILHAGTNDLPTGTADCCVTKIVNLALRTRDKFPDAKIGVSSLTHREDIDISTKIQEVNKKLKGMAVKNNFAFIDNSHIDGSCLNGSKLHLNSKGSAYLATSFIKFLNPNSTRRSSKLTKDFQSPLHQLGQLLVQATQSTATSTLRRKPHR